MPDALRQYQCDKLGYVSLKKKQPCCRAQRIQDGRIRLEVTPEYKAENTGGGAPASTADTVSYKYELTNSGVLNLYDIELRDGVLQAHGTVLTCEDADGETFEGSIAGAVAGLARKPDNGLPPGEQLVCTGTDVVTQEEVWSSRSATFSHVRQIYYLQIYHLQIYHPQLYHLHTYHLQIDPRLDPPGKLWVPDPQYVI